MMFPYGSVCDKTIPATVQNFATESAGVGAFASARGQMLVRRFMLIEFVHAQ